MLKNILMWRTVIEACCADACSFCAWLGCLKTILEEHQKSQHGECMLQVMYLFRNKFDGSNISIHPHFTKNRTKLRTWAPVQHSTSLGEVHCTLRYLQRLCSIGVVCGWPRVTLLCFGITWEDQLPLQATFSNGWFVLDNSSKHKRALKMTDSLQI